jgi:hypothetical protein
MTWEQRAEAGVDAKHFQEELKAPKVSETGEGLGRKTAPSRLLARSARTPC